MKKKYVVMIFLALLSSCRFAGQWEELKNCLGNTKNSIQTPKKVSEEEIREYLNSKKVSKEEIKEYLNSKNITVESIDEVSEIEGMYEINASAKDTFYINQDRKIFFGMILNLDTAKNITLAKRNNSNSEIDITNGHLSPVKAKPIPNPIPQDIHIMFELKTPDDYEKLIKNMEDNIKGLRLKQQQILSN